MEKDRWKEQLSLRPFQVFQSYQDDGRTLVKSNMQGTICSKLTTSRVRATGFPKRYIVAVGAVGGGGGRGGRGYRKANLCCSCCGCAILPRKCKTVCISVQ